MIKIFSAGALLAIGVTPTVAQDYCAQVRQGIAQYGYNSALQYAAQHYTAEEVKAINLCIAKLRLRRQASADTARD